MRTYSLVALAILTLTIINVAQSPQTLGESSSKVSATTGVEVPDDAAFSAYLHVTGNIKPPKATKSPDPAYPKIPVDAEPSGIVVMLVGINSKGHVELVHVLRASNEAFQDSAVSTVKTWRFSPAKKDGKPVPVQVTVEMHFAK